ncbi:MAG: NAD(P)H-dependent oxidoreductase [Nanoarchaeota archaeon]
MKILAINGSPRKGNTRFILDRLLDHSDIIDLKDKDIDFCDGSDECSTKTGKCKIADDMVDVYDRLEEAEVIVLASPCYFYNVSALMKNFMDRCNVYYFNKKLKGKKFYLIMVGGHEESIKEGLKCMSNFVKGIYGEVFGLYHVVADKIGEVDNSKVIKEIEKIKLRLT